MPIRLRPTARIADSVHPLLPWLQAQRDLAAGVALGRVRPAAGDPVLAPVAAVGESGAYEAVYLRVTRYLGQLETPLAPGTAIHAVYLAADRALDDSTNLNMACDLRAELATRLGDQANGAYALARYRDTLKDVLHTVIDYDRTGTLPPIDATRLAAARAAARTATGHPPAAATDAPPTLGPVRRVVSSLEEVTVVATGGRRTIVMD